MTNDAPLTTVSSEPNRVLEEAIVSKTLRKAHGLGMHHDIDEIFVVAIEGIDDHPDRFVEGVRTSILTNIEIQAEKYGLRVTHKYRWACEFQLKERKRP